MLLNLNFTLRYLFNTTLKYYFPCRIQKIKKFVTGDYYFFTIVDLFLSILKLY